jgi:protein-L-isoaspartate(D-aspartate) O-methyltransferase
MMVDTQVRPSDVTKLPLIQAMLHVPRERFVPDALAEIAYLGENLTLSPDRVILDPRTLSKMLDALNIGPTDLVLDVAPGLGYSSAVIAQMAEAVIALEPDADLAAEAEAALAASEIGNVIVVERPGSGRRAAPRPLRRGDHPGRHRTFPGRDRGPDQGRRTRGGAVHG